MLILILKMIAFYWTFMALVCSISALFWVTGSSIWIEKIENIYLLPTVELRKRELFLLRGNSVEGYVYGEFPGFGHDTELRIFKSLILKWFHLEIHFGTKLNLL